MLREVVKSESPEGAEIKRAMVTGQLVDDAMITRIVAQRTGKEDCEKGYLLDGYPRTVAQAKMLDAMLRERDQQVDYVVAIAVPDRSLVRRIVGRSTCTLCGEGYHDEFKPSHFADRCEKCGGPLKRRADDNEHTVKQRIVVYHQETEPLIEYYRRQGVFHTVNGDQDLARVSRDLCLTLGCGRARASTTETAA
ncbi:putative adenylate kinase [Magnetofaba australis IT-1]|uniref:Adenylate kinase n=2 Tax=Magnetofaba TaxID=1472292 RepID=A0A1Y2K4W0_9PROT|nr:putative adenylate kinase [Magnetofaba australis IT-1]